MCFIPRFWFRKLRPLYKHNDLKVTQQFVQYLIKTESRAQTFNDLKENIIQAVLHLKMCFQMNQVCELHKSLSFQV